MCHFFFRFDAKGPGKQLFSNVGTEPPLSWYYQYFCVCVCVWGGVNMSCSRTQHGDLSGPRTPTSGSGVGVVNHQAGVERTGAVVKPRTLGLEVPGSSSPVAVRCGLEQVAYPQLLR